MAVRRPVPGPGGSLPLDGPSAADRVLHVDGWTRIIGLGLIGYALLYPFLTIALGHKYPATPTFGVPCPTDLLTIGALLTIRGRVPAALAVIPVVWGIIGGSAAVLLAVPTDYVLLGAGVLLATLLFGWPQVAK